MASRFWVGGTGTWDASDTSHWAASSGGASGASVPGSADSATLDGSSGGGTVTVNTTVTVQTITCGAFTGTLDFSANNNNVTLSAIPAFSGTGSGARTINLGNGTWTLNATSAGTIWDIGTITNLTFNANSSIISLTGNAAGGVTRTFQGGGLTYSTLQISAAQGPVTVGGINTFSVLTGAAGSSLSLSAAQTVTTLNLNGTSGNSVFLTSNALTTQRALTITTLNATWAAFRAISGSGSATNSADLGFNTGITITAPSAGGSAGLSRARAFAGLS